MLRIAAGFLVIGCGATVAAQGADPPLADVLKRAAGYVAEYQTRLAGIVAEEHYEQSATRLPSPGSGITVPQRRELKSDLLLVRLDGESQWIQFRDVFEVDRRPIRDRDERLMKLFLEPKRGARMQAEAISQEGARFNIGPLWRTVNVPILGLAFFEARHQSRFSYKRSSAVDLKGFAEANEADIWAIDYRETASPTLIRGRDDRDVRSNGRTWIDSRNGRVLKTELQSGNADVFGEIIVTYRTEPGLDLLVPGEMREQYLLPKPMTRIAGRATYSRFRQFRVTTSEKTNQ